MATTRVFSGRAARGLGRTRRVAPLVAFFAMALLMWGLLFANAASPAWASTMTVNSLDDGTPANDGKCTLREAITNANADNQSGSTDCPAGSGSDLIDIGVRGTVNLTGVLSDLSSNIEIEGPGADQLTVKRDTGGDYGIFKVTSGGVVSISGITVSGGNVPDRGGSVPDSSGGGVYNDGGTLTISRSTISSNSASSGGGVFSDTDLSGTQKSTITNSTISGNSAQSLGGGVYNAVGLTAIEHSTITENTGLSGGGSGVGSFGGSDTRTEVLSTIVSENTNTDVDLAPDIGTNSFSSKGYNLIGDGNATAAFNQSGDQSGVSDPKLGALANNGGPTQTHALLATSAAIDAIPQGTNGCGTTFTEDQRGVSRPQGSACDIGSFEVDQPPTVTINQASVQADPATSPINFTAVFNEPVSGFSASGVTLSGTAGATTVVVNEIAPNNDTTYDVAVSGMSAEGTVIASIPANVAQDTDGNANTASTSTDNIVTFIANRPPTAVADSYSVNEDDTLNVAAPGVLANDTDPDTGDTLEAVLVSGPGHAASFTLNADGSFTYEPDDNFNGADSFTYKANDGTEDSNTATVSISVTAANDVPTVTVDGGGSCGSSSDMRGTINLALSDPDNPPQSLTLTATSSNRSVLPNSNISFGGGTDASRTMTVSSLTGSGTSNVIIRVSDEGDLNGTVLVRVIFGSASNNTLTGSANSDMIFARKGSDTLSAQGANDLMCGGNGNDRLTGGLGADRFGGGSGTDTATDFDEGQGDTKAGIP